MFFSTVYGCSLRASPTQNGKIRDAIFIIAAKQCYKRSNFAFPSNHNIYLLPFKYILSIFDYLIGTYIRFTGFSPLFMHYFNIFSFSIRESGLLYITGGGLILPFKLKYSFPVGAIFFLFKWYNYQFLAFSISNH